MTINELRDRLINLSDISHVRTVDTLIEEVVAGTDWDFNEVKALFISSFSTELSDD